MVLLLMLTLKTFSTLSLPMQTTTFNAMNVVNLDVCTISPPHPIHLSSTVMRSSVNSIKETWYSFLSPLTRGHDLAQCYRHSSPPPTTPAKNLGAPHTPNSKYHRPNANLMCERASQPPCPLGILTSADIRRTQSVSPTRRTFFGNSYTAPTPSLHTLQLVGLSILSNVYSSLLCNPTRTFQRRSATIPVLFDCCLLVPMLILLTSLGLIQRHHPIDAENSANTSRGMVQFQY